jgi:5-oxopent-3-ene-1,2,5-tricarboxylate decarboxylase/2-hydroxyhepta-2,4-diene-1,7-dioate isomerase
MLQDRCFAGNLAHVSDLGHREETEMGRDPAVRMPQRAQRVARIELGGQPVWGRIEEEHFLAADGRRLRESEVRYLAPVEPSKIIAVHLSYRSRIDEYRARPPAHPSYFMKPPSALNGHRGVLRRPRGSRFLNYEGELAVIVGRRMKGVPAAEALDYVAGYVPANDVGLHDFRHADRGSMLRVKGQDGFLPLGPELVPASEFDPRRFTLRTYLNGELVQEGRAQEMLWDVAYQLADVCRLITLEPGDVLLTGTPANSRPMQPGDRVAVEIDGLGRLENEVVEWDVDLSGAGEQPAVSANTLHVALAIPEEEAERMIEGESA